MHRLTQLPAERHGDLSALLQLTVRGASGKLVPIRELVTISDGLREQTVYHKDLAPVHFVVAEMAGKVDSPLYGMFQMRSKIADIQTPDGGRLGEYFIHQPSDAWRGYAIKWDGEWQITYETFRDMGAAYGVGLILIYLLVVAQFRSYLTPLVIMAPIPLTVIGVMPGHALLGSQFTATSMIGMIALAGIIVRNSILLVDFAIRAREDTLAPDGSLLPGLAQATCGTTAARAAQAALVWASKSWGRRCVVSSHFADNPASGAVLIKSGFLYTGEVDHAFSVARGEVVDAEVRGDRQRLRRDRPHRPRKLPERVECQLPCLPPTVTADTVGPSQFGCSIPTDRKSVV